MLSCRIPDSSDCFGIKAALWYVGLMLDAKSNRIALPILLLTIFLDWMSIGLVYPMYSSMIFHEGAHLFSPETSDVVKGVWLGILLASGPLAQFFSSPVVGTFSDQKGRKPLLKATLVTIVFGYILCATGVWIESLACMLAGRLIVGIGTGNAAVVFASIADISKPEEKAKRFGLASMASGLGFTLGPFLGGTLSAYGFATPFLFSAVFSLINFILILALYRETHHVRRQVHLSLILGLKNLKKALRTPGLSTFFLCFFFFCAGWSFYWEFIPVTWIQDYGLTSAQVGNLYAYGAAFYALSSGLLIRPIVNRFPPLSVLFVALVLLVAAIFPMLLHSDVAIFWGYVPVQQFLIALVFPTGATIISNSVSQDSQGEMLGVLQSVDSFAFASSPIVAGFFVGLSAEAPILIAGGFMALASLILLKSFIKKSLS